MKWNANAMFILCDFSDYDAYRMRYNVRTIFVPRADGVMVQINPGFGESNGFLHGESIKKIYNLG
jgi:hypothetical protein